MPKSLSGSEFNFNDLPNNYSVMRDANGKPTGIGLNGQEVAQFDENGNVQFNSLEAKEAYDKAMQNKRDQQAAAAKENCEKRGGSMSQDGKCMCPDGRDSNGAVCVEAQQEGSWLSRNWLTLAGVALGVAGILLALRKDKGKKGKDGQDAPGTEPEPVSTEDLARGGNYGSIVPSSGGYSRGDSGSGSGGGSTGSGGGSGGGTGEEGDDKEIAGAAAAQRAVAGDGAIAAYTYAKKNLGAADAFPKKAEEISQQIDDAQTWRDAFQAVINADYAAYTESARFLTVLATEGEQKSTDIIGNGVLPRIQEVTPEEGEE
ncbi:MAG: hypothetical protein PHX68_02035 [Alphaproteobacteria bacterium]|nr:hypothetical protein [Alphaproteobacteria bacterium]